MKLKNKFWLILIVIIIVGLIAAKLTGFYQVYTLPTTSMEPSLHVNQMTLFTNLKNPKNNDIIAFTRRVNERYETDPNGKKIVNCFRLIAKEGDKLEIKNGYAYVNGQLTDDTTALKFPYILSTKDFSNILTLLEIDDGDSRLNSDFFTMGDESIALLSYEEYSKAKVVIPLTRNPINPEHLSPSIFSKNKWTVDDFGPYVVPPDHLFVMGDNRHNAMDSRYYGPISVKDYKGVMFAKF